MQLRRLQQEEAQTNRFRNNGAYSSPRDSRERCREPGKFPDLMSSLGKVFPLHAPLVHNVTCRLLAVVLYICHELSLPQNLHVSMHLLIDNTTSNSAKIWFTEEDLCRK